MWLINPLREISFTCNVTILESRYRAKGRIVRRDYWESGKQKRKATDKQQGQRNGIDGRLEVGNRNMGAKK